MQAFSRLFEQLDASNRTNDKIRALCEFFRTASDPDAAWAVALLSGHKIRRPVPPSRLREWIASITGYPLWLIETAYDRVGDLAETIALLHPAGTETPSADRSLAEVMQQEILPLREADPATQQAIVTAAWRRLDPPGRFVFNKLLTGGFRVGVQKSTVIKALAQTHGEDPRAIAQVLTGNWRPTPEFYRRIRCASSLQSPALNPYVFALAHPLNDSARPDPSAALGNRSRWQVEWKWDGIRAQVVHRKDGTAVWSRGEELIDDTFPEIRELAQNLPVGTVLDGEILVWDFASRRPRPFGDLQKRLGRKQVGPKLLADCPCIFMAYDLLESDGVPQIDQPTDVRRQHLMSVAARTDDPRLHASPVLPEAEWDALATGIHSSRERGVEGYVLKRRDAPYHSGRVRGAWWKWKIDPLTIDAVLLYAQGGHGRRAGLLTDYTLAVRKGEEWVPFAKAYSGLTDAEIRRVDQWIKQNTTERFGPVRAVRPELVFEIGFEAIRPSPRHRSGIAVRFPRILRWRTDLTPADADTLDSLRSLLPNAHHVEVPQ